jgi:hypothetical protein
MHSAILLTLPFVAVTPGQVPVEPTRGGGKFYLTPLVRPVDRERVAVVEETVGGDEVVLTWNEATLKAIRAEKTPPPLAARQLAMVHVAIYDAVNPIRCTHETFRIDADPQPGTSPVAAAAAAAHRVLIDLYPDRTRQFDDLLARSLEAVRDRNARQKGVSFGRSVAREVLAWRAEDGSDREVEYVRRREAGAWNPTPPAYAPPLAPHWPAVAGFAIRRGSQFRPEGPPKVTSSKYAEAFQEVKRLGGKSSTARTRDQTEIAHFWADGEGTVTPPGHWNRIAQDVSRRRGLTLAENARLFALLNIAMADVAIACWDCKYHFNMWRPVQAIPEAHRDDNPDTDPDPTWEPLLPTPPFPAYTSGHSSFSAAGATVLAAYFGTDDVRFETTSEGLPGVTRKFDGFWAAAEEAGMSRIYGGIHWQFDNTDGLAGGRKVARYVVENFLRPCRE